MKSMQSLQKKFRYLAALILVAAFCLMGVHQALAEHAHSSHDCTVCFAIHSSHSAALTLPIVIPPRSIAFQDISVTSLDFASFAPAAFSLAAPPRAPPVR